MLALYKHQIEALKITEDQNRVAIPGYEGIYEIDSLGTVYCILQDRYHKPHIMKPFDNGIGYLRVTLRNVNHKAKKHYIHRLVAEAFIPNPENKPNVNHKDCNTKNNCKDNLEWCTQSENIQYSYDLGRQANNIVNYNAKKRGDAKCHG